MKKPKSKQRPERLAPQEVIKQIEERPADPQMITDTRPDGMHRQNREGIRMPFGQGIRHTR